MLNKTIKLGTAHWTVAFLAFGTMLYLITSCKKHYGSTDLFKINFSDHLTLQESLISFADENGRFKSISCSDLSMTKQCRNELTLFDSYLIYDNLKLEKNTLEYNSSLARFLSLTEKERIEPNLWKFGMQISSDHSDLPPDMDDTANAIKLFNIPGDYNYEILEKNRNSNNFFNTWIPDQSDKNKIDCSVNINTLRVLPSSNENKRTFLQILNFFRNDTLSECNMFYVGNLVPSVFLWKLTNEKYLSSKSEVEAILNQVIQNSSSLESFHDQAILTGLELRLKKINRPEAIQRIHELKNKFFRSDYSPRPVYWDISGKRYFGSDLLSASYAFWALHGNDLAIKH